MSGTPENKLPGDDNIQKGEPVPPQLVHERDWPVLDRINPDSALPAHLQHKSFDRDIWDRVKQHPLRNPILNRNKLDEDAESREIVRQVMAAANEREKEVLLHNQSRVFREILGRVVDRISDFLNRPLLPARWNPRIPAVATVVETDPPPGDNAAANSVGGKSWWMGVLTAVLTPKYILLALVILLGLVAGYKQTQVMNLQEAVTSYKVASEATGNLQNEMRNLVTTTQSDRDKFEQTRRQLDAELANVRADNKDKSDKIATLTANLTHATQDLAAAKAENQQYRDKQDVTVAGKQKELDSVQEKLKVAETELAATKERVTGLDIQIKELQERVTQGQAILNERGREVDTLRQKNSEQFDSIAALERDRTILRFAETALHNIRQDANGWAAIDKDRVRQFLREFDTAKQNVQGRQ